MHWIKEKWFITSVFIVLGGIGGYLYWYFIGCNSGTCPITSRPLNSTLYGLVMGFLMSGVVEDFRKRGTKSK